MRQYKVSPTLKASVKNVLDRRAIPYQDRGNQLAVDIPSDKFHKIVVRAIMEKKQEEDNCNIPYLDHTELSDQEVLNEIGTAYIVQ